MCELVKPGVADKGDVLLAPQHMNQLVEQPLLLGAPLRGRLNRPDKDASVVGKWVWDVIFLHNHARTLRFAATAIRCARLDFWKSEAHWSSLRHFFGE